MGDILQDLHNQWDKTRQGFHDPLWGRSIAELDRLRAEYDEMGVLLADKHNVISALRAELAGVQKAYSEFIDTSKQTIEALRKRVGELEARERNHIEVANRRLARAEQAEKRVGELKAEQEKTATLAGLWSGAVLTAETQRDAAIARAEQAEAQLAEAKEIAGGLARYADGHDLRPKWAAELRDLKNRLAALNSSPAGKDNT